MKKTLLLFLAVLLLQALPVFAKHKIRLSAASGYFIENRLAGDGTVSLAAKLTVAYPVTPREKDINMEIGILSLYEAQLSGDAVQVPGFGFGIRIFYNGFGSVRPYFNHEVLTRIINAAGKNGSAKTYSILLGLGLDFPLEQGREKEVPSIFADLSYVFYDTGYFEIAGDKVKSINLTAGYSFPF